MRGWGNVVSPEHYRRGARRGLHESGRTLLRKRLFRHEISVLEPTRYLYDEYLKKVQIRDKKISCSFKIFWIFFWVDFVCGDVEIMKDCLGSDKNKRRGKKIVFKSSSQFHRLIFRWFRVQRCNFYPDTPFCGKTSPWFIKSQNPRAFPLL